MLNWTLFSLQFARVDCQAVEEVRATSLTEQQPFILVGVSLRAYLIQWEKLQTVDPWI